MALNWEDLRLFLAVAEAGSLSAAARQLRLGQPTLSRRIAELEAEVGASLFIRLAQGCKLTEIGERLLPSAQRMAEWANEADACIGPPLRTRISGKVKIAAPPGIAFEVLAPLAADIRAQYPELHIEALSGVQVLNLARGEADISLRTTRPNDPDLLCLAEVNCPMAIYASKNYAAKFSQASTLAELDWICWAPPYEHLYINQVLQAQIPNFVPAFTSDDFNVQIAACRAGTGVMLLAKALHRNSLLKDLVELPIELGTQAKGELFLVVHKRQHPLPRVQCVINFLINEFEKLNQAGNQGETS